MRGELLFPYFCDYSCFGLCVIWGKEVLIYMFMVYVLSDTPNMYNKGFKYCLILGERCESLFAFHVIELHVM
jgi:hypothetical protein